MSNKFCGPDIIKFFSVEPIPPNPCSFEPISVQNLEGCQFLNITGYTGPTINLPNLSLTDINGAYDTTQMVSGLTISNGEITSFTLDGCGLSIDVNAPSPFPINLNNSDGCNIGLISTDPSGTFILDDTEFTDLSGVFDTSPISKNININAYISSISASTDGCETIIQIEDCFPLDIVNTSGCTIDTIDECCKGNIWNARLGSGSFIQDIDLVNCGGKVYTDPTRYDGTGIYQFCHAGLTQPNVQVQSGSILWTDTGERCNMPVILNNPSITDDDGLFGNYPAANNLIIENGTVDTITTSGCTTTITLNEVVGAITYPQVIYHRNPSYTSGATGDYPYLYNTGYFDLWLPTVPVDMIRLGSDNFTLAENNRFGNNSRYTSTDGTPSDVGTARFSSYGTGTKYIVRDNFFGIMWYNQPSGGSSTTLDNSQSEVDTLNSISFGGYSDWIVPTRDMLSLSCSPNNNQAIHTSPNLIEDSGTRRYLTCERLPYISQGYQVFFSNGGESTQSLTSTASGQNRVIAGRIMSLTELFG